MNPKTGPASALAAWRRGKAGGADATLWLARALRLAPDDPRIAIDYASRKLAGGPADIAQAEAMFARLSKAHDALPVWLGLATARYKLGDGAGAAAALEQLLGRHYVPAAAGFMELAHAIALSAGYDGVCGLRASGERVASGTGRLLGAPVDVAALSRIIGVVSASEAGLAGWACRPAALESVPELTLHDALGTRLAVTFGKPLPADLGAPLLVRYGFKIGQAALAGLTPPFSLKGPDGAHLSGSPVDPAVRLIPPVPARKRGPAITQIPPDHPFAVVIPVYRGLKETEACLDSVFAAVPAGTDIILVDDATPEPALAAWLDGLAENRRIKLHRHKQNLGFAAAVNTGLKAAQGRDVLLLNSDTLVPPMAIPFLRGAAYQHADTGSVTPFSNEASIMSYPKPSGGNPAPDLAETVRLSELAVLANGAETIEIPTGVGFCMYLRHDCIAAAGGFRPEIFAQGYGEENDWCLRARHLGFRHRAALGVYVAHAGGVSFGAATRGLMARNGEILNRLYPGYDAMVRDFIARDPLRPARARMDERRLAPARESVLLISHSHGGGVGRQVAVRMAAWRADGLRPLLLTTRFPENPHKAPYPWPALLSEGNADDYPNLVFNLPGDWKNLLRLLRAARVTRVELHHTLGHHPTVRRAAAALNVPQDIIIHDYALFCRRVTLFARPAPGEAGRYCGEPAMTGCIACCQRDKAGLAEPLPVKTLLARSAAELAQAARVIAPSHDAARRIARHFPGIKPDVTPWEDDLVEVSLRPLARTGRRKIIVIGGIGAAKGYDILLNCARDARTRGLGLEFVIAGRSADDAKLLRTGGIFISGGYKEGEAGALIAGFEPDLAFFPSQWPETWCFALSEAWAAGLYAVAFDLGAQAERIRATGRGTILPLGLPYPRINDVLLNWSP